MILDLDTHAVAFDDIAPAKSGAAPSVILGHCFGANRVVWDPILPSLGEYRVIRFDTRGHSHSSTPLGPYRMDDLGDDVIALMDFLDLPRAHYVGISMSRAPMTQGYLER